MDEIVLEVGPIYTTINYPDTFPKYYRQQLNNLLGSVMKARPDGFQFSPKYRQHMWDGYIKLFKNNEFPTGLFDRAVELLDKYSTEFGYNVLTASKKKYKKLSIDNIDYNLNGFELRDYQKKAVKTMLFCRKGIAKIATNGGKTLIIAAICKNLNLPTLILTTKKELLYQLSEVIEKVTGEPVGLIGDSRLDLGTKFTVATIQSLQNHIDALSDKQVLIIDECHHTSSKTMMDVVMEIPASYRFGFSGTPLKNDVLSDLQLIAATGEVLIEVTNEELVNEGFSAKPEIRVYNVNNPKDDLDYIEAYSQLIVNNEKRNGKIVSLANKALEAEKVVLVLVDKIEHQNILFAKYNKHYPSDQISFMNGNHSTEYRKEQIENMREGEPHVYLATEILSEGVDIPSIDVLILASGGKSYIKVLQRVGRGMRRKEGNNKLIVIDFKDLGNKYLEKHSKERIKIYQNEKFEIKELEIT